MFTIWVVKFILSFLTMAITLIWMVNSFHLVINYVSLVGDKHRDYHKNHIKLTGVFVLNLLVFIECARTLICPKMDTMYIWLGSMNNEIILNVFLLIRSIFLLVGISYLNIYSGSIRKRINIGLRLIK